MSDTAKLLECQHCGRAFMLTRDYVSLLPLSPLVRGVSTDGLRFALREEELPMGPSRGLSNEMTGARASVRSQRGLLLVVHTDAAAEHR